MTKRLPLCLTRAVLAGVLIALGPAAVRAQASPPAAQAQPQERPPERPQEPADYRMGDYRQPVPATLSGARVVGADEAHRLWQAKGAFFIDVLPHAPKPPNLPADTVWRDKPRRDIPGSLWLPDTGYGVLAAPTLAYFERGLAKASAGDKAKPLLFYCLTNCWQSWNAAKRALSLGYSSVLWYPEGTDGWEAAGHPLEDRAPEPRD